MNASTWKINPSHKSPGWLVAWPGGRGTADCREQATALGIRIIEAGDIERWHARALELRALELRTHAT